MPLIEDRRIARDRPVYVIADGDFVVQVPDEVRKCVAFVMYQASDGMHYAGTAFFAGEPVPDTHQSVQWIVTAAHVINAIVARSLDAVVWLRINLKAGGSGYVHVPAARWATHPTDDVAAVSIGLPDTFDYRQWSLGPEGIVTPEVIEQRAVGVGDEVFLTGLFANHPGRERTIPIVRAGNIAAMPDEPIRSKTWGEIRNGYLVEARSIGGLSGSPVFLYTGFTRRKRDGTLELGGGGPMYYLLGLMHGHFPGELSEADIESPERRDQINLGIAVVVPVQSLMETITQQRFDVAKDELRKAALNEKAAMADDMDAPADEAPSTGFESKGEFGPALGKVSRRKPSPPDETTSGT